jgi:peptidoglycan-associated lipoprotein
MTKRRALLLLLLALLLILAAGCKKKTPPPPPPPAPAPAPPPANKPVINYFTAEPTTISSGQPASLRWSVNDAANVQIDNGIGQVSPNGRRAVYPTSTTTYHMTATGPGGSADAETTVTVSAPPPPAPTPAPPTQTAAQMLASQVQDVHFDYDKSEIGPEQQPILQADATALKTIFSMDASFVVTIEGHCDERGSAEYNIGLGDRRAAATRDALVNMGISSDKLKTISYGKERPVCTDATEDCYARNRRAHFSAGQ